MLWEVSNEAVRWVGTMSRTVTLALEANLSDRRIADLSRELTRDIRRSTDFAADPETRPARPGERALGAPLLGRIALTFISAGSATALINVLKSYIERDRRVTFRFSSPDGTTLELAADHLEAADVTPALEQLRSFLDHEPD